MESQVLLWNGVSTVVLAFVLIGVEVFFARRMSKKIEDHASAVKRFDKLQAKVDGLGARQAVTERYQQTVLDAEARLRGDERP